MIKKDREGKEKMMKKKLSLILLLTLLLFCQSMIGFCAQSSTDEYLWRVDTQNASHLPRNFRTTNDAFKTSSETLPSTMGMDQLYESGSAQFSQLEFEAMLPTLKKMATGPIYVVDLRQEDHGLLNGIGVSWFGDHNWANVGKTLEEVQTGEQIRIKATLGTTITISALDDNKKASNSQEITVNHAVTEGEFITAHGINYFRISATDHRWPSPENIDRFIAFYNTLPKDAWLHFHCQAGEGRTTAYMIMYDMMRNSNNVSMDDIIQRQILIGGQNILKTKATKKKDAWKNELYEEKVVFIKKFYQYTTEMSGDFSMTWSQWLSQHKE